MQGIHNSDSSQSVEVYGNHTGKQKRLREVLWDTRQNEGKSTDRRDSWLAMSDLQFERSLIWSMLVWAFRQE